MRRSPHQITAVAYFVRDKRIALVAQNPRNKLWGLNNKESLRDVV